MFEYGIHLFRDKVDQSRDEVNISNDEVYIFGDGSWRQEVSKGINLQSRGKNSNLLPWTLCRDLEMLMNIQALKQTF